MMSIFRLRKFTADQNGGTAIEYAMLAAGIGLTLAMTVSLLGDRMMTTYGNIADAIAISDRGPDDAPDCSNECTDKMKDKNKQSKKKPDKKKKGKKKS